MDFQTAPVVAQAIPDGFRLIFNGPIHTNVAWLEREMDRVVAAKPKEVHFDLTGTKYISSMGLALLVGFNKRITANGGAIKIVAIHKQTMHLLTVAYLHTVFKVEPGAVIEPPAGA